MAREPQGVGALPRLEAQGDDAHAHEVAAVDALEAYGNHRPHTLPETDNVDTQQPRKHMLSTLQACQKEMVAAVDALKAYGDYCRHTLPETQDHQHTKKSPPSHSAKNRRLPAHKEITALTPCQKQTVRIHSKLVNTYCTACGPAIKRWLQANNEQPVPTVYTVLAPQNDTDTAREQRSQAVRT